jgi:multidrug transporter EmrE-like cation transporter
VRYFFLVLALVMNAGANILLKMGSKTAKVLPSDAALLDKAMNFLNPLTIVAIVLFAANVLAYRKALDAFNLSIAYPIMVSGGLVLVTAAAWALPVFHEEITWLQLVGIVLIAIGVWLVTMPVAAAR